MAVDREALARALREARENHGMSQEAAAKRVGLSRTVLAQIELGNRGISSDEMTGLAKLYGRTVSDFSPDAGSDDALAMISAHVPSELPLWPDAADLPRKARQPGLRPVLPRL